MKDAAIRQEDTLEMKDDLELVTLTIDEISMIGGGEAVVNTI